MAGPCCKRSLEIFSRWMESLRPTMCTRSLNAASDGNAINGYNVRSLIIDPGCNEKRFEIWKLLWL